MIVIATAGWSIPRASSRAFAGEGTHLQRYARVLRGVEINSSFYREHAVATYARWASQTPRGFRFALKLPRQITHDLRLRAARRPLREFLASVAGLGRRLGPLVVQLPPSLPFEARVARTFFSMLRDQHEGLTACEPRHASWFEDRPDALLARHHVGRIAADPAIVPAAKQPGGWTGMVYYRLHGSPRMYWSVYDDARVGQWAQSICRTSHRIPVWCVFDNTASSGAMVNALQMRRAVARYPE